MASKLLVGVAVVGALVVIAGILLFTVARDDANRTVADWLVRQATTGEEHALFSLAQRLHDESGAHAVFACASEAAAPDESWDADALAAAAGMPEGAWTVEEAGERDGVSYVIVEGAPAGVRDPEQFDWRPAEVAGRMLTCAVPVES